MDPNSTSASNGIAGGPEVYRIVLHPTSESLYTDLRLLDESLGGNWVDEDVLEVESKILVSHSSLWETGKEGKVEGGSWRSILSARRRHSLLLTSLHTIPNETNHHL